MPPSSDVDEDGKEAIVFSAAARLRPTRMICALPPRIRAKTWVMASPTPDVAPVIRMIGTYEGVNVAFDRRATAREGMVGDGDITSPNRPHRMPLYDKKYAYRDRCVL